MATGNSSNGNGKKSSVKHEPADRVRADAARSKPVKPSNSAKPTASTKQSTSSSSRKPATPAARVGADAARAKAAKNGSSQPRKVTPRTAPPATKSAPHGSAHKPSGSNDRNSASRSAHKSSAPRHNENRVRRETAVAKTDGKRKSVSSANRKKSKKRVVIIVVAVVAVLLIALAVTLVLVLGRDRRDTYVNPYSTVTKVGYSAEYLGTVPRNIPTETHDEGLGTGYPVYGSTMGNLTAEQKSAIIAESSYLCAVPTVNASGTYDMMDGEGNLYLNGAPLGRKLYKHSAAVGQYLGDVSDDEPAVVKRVTLAPRGYTGYGITGLYAPAGEVIKIEMSEAGMDVTGGITVHIGQALYNGKANNIWSARDINRMPVVLNTMNVNKSTATLDGGVYTAYVGSYLGGPIYIRNTSATVTVTISGAVNYSHFILGYTDRAEFEKNAASSAPYFDLEVWEYGVLHSGPKTYAADFAYDDIYNAAVLWDKISLVSTQVAQKGIVFLYDPFVAAGAAVAFPGQNSVNCPTGWMKSALDCDAFERSGAWGNMHEYNHNFQGWGLGDGGEVTNNALSLVSYSLFTEVSAVRRLGASGDGLGGWNRYMSGAWALEQVTSGKFENGVKGLASYAVLLHSFGQEAFMTAVRASGGQSVDKWFHAATLATHCDMSFFIKDMLGLDVSQSVLDVTKAHDYPMFVPVETIYRTGKSYTFDGEKKYVTTMQPYEIEYGKEFVMDLTPYTVENGMHVSGSLVLPSGITAKVKSVSNPEHGSIKQASDGKYVYKPDENIRSGKIYVTLELTKDDGAFDIADVELVVEFKQSHEINKSVLERTTYSYSADGMYTDPVEAYNAGYAGYTKVESGDSVNSVQNSNTDAWFAQAPVDSVVEIRGKLYVAQDGDYRIAIRGRRYAALYVSTDGKNFELAANMKNETNSNKFIDSPDNYRDLVGLKAGQWVYFKEVLCVTYASSFVGLGWGKFETPSGTINGSGEFVDENGDPVSAEPTVTVDYATACRNSYETVDDDFVSEYFFTRKYTYTCEEQDGAAEHISPDSPVITYKGEWKTTAAPSSFGHVYEGKKNATAEFEFVGTRFALLYSKSGAYGNIEIYIDGKKAVAASQSGELEPRSVILSPVLSHGKHTVKIKCKAAANIDSIAVWQPNAARNHRLILQS